MKIDYSVVAWVLSHLKTDYDQNVSREHILNPPSLMSRSRSDSADYSVKESHRVQ